MRLTGGQWYRCAACGGMGPNRPGRIRHRQDCSYHTRKA